MHTLTARFVTKIFVGFTKTSFPNQVLSKAHAMILYEDNKFLLVDTGSSNGTFVNNIRLSKTGAESDMTEIFTGDIIR